MIRRPPISALFPCATLFRSEACRRLGVWFVSDEIYHGLTYGEPAATALAFDEDAVVINSFSKYYCMTGWRIGWIVVPEWLVRPPARVPPNLYLSAPLPPRGGGPRALVGRGGRATRQGGERPHR